MYSGHQEYIDNPDSLLLSSSRNMSGIGGLVPQQQQTPPSFHMHPQQQQQQNSFGPMTISPPNHNIGAPFQDPSTQWFGTSLESNGSSFGQSPVFGTKDLLVTPSSSTGHLMEGYSGPENGDGIQRSHQELFEKRRRRRESHNAVERRRRDNINDRIHELSTLLPDHLLDSVPASSNVMTVTTGQNGTNGKPINKGTILKLSVDHIKELKGEVMSYKDKIRDLERRIEAAKRGDINQDPTMTIKQEDGGMNIYNQQQQHQQQQAIHLIPNKGHERAGSAQFQQKFGKLNIACNNPQQQS